MIEVVHLPPRYHARARVFALSLVCAVAAAACSTGHQQPTSRPVPTATPAPTATPGVNVVTGTATAPLPTGPITLATWQLTLPLTGRKGDATIVDPAVPTAPYLVPGADGALTFWAPVTGTTTPNSTHARTELDNHVSFLAGTGHHLMTATVSVGQLPTEKPDVVVGQIHGAGPISSVSFVLVHYLNGQIDVVVKHAQTGTDGTHIRLLDNIPMRSE